MQAEYQRALFFLRNEFYTLEPRMGGVWPILEIFSRHLSFTPVQRTWLLFDSSNLFNNHTLLFHNFQFSRTDCMFFISRNIRDIA
jgi:hypothetical protein